MPSQSCHKIHILSNNNILISNTRAVAYEINLSSNEAKSSVILIFLLLRVPKQMSVVSSRVSSVSSILKTTGVRSQLIKQSNKVYFTLPKDVKCILNNFQTGNKIKEYENLIQLLRDGSVKVILRSIHVLCSFKVSSFMMRNDNRTHCFFYLLRSTQDSNLAEFLADVSQYVASLSARHELFVQTLLRIDWLNRSPDVIANYKLFLQDLICVQTCYIRTVIHHLVNLLKPEKIIFGNIKIFSRRLLYPLL